MGEAVTNFDHAFSAIPEQIAERWGFRLGDKGTHSTRTIMIEELTVLLAAVPGEVERERYARAVLEENCLGKRTTATRRLTLQRLRELYALDTDVPLFRILLQLWQHHETSRPLLALLTALARDPLLRITAPVVLETPMGEELSRQRLLDSLSRAVGHRFNESILDKIARNAASSWTQSGHLDGRVRKIRRQIDPPPAACAFALLLGYLLGKRGRSLFETPWIEVLDCPMDRLLDLAAEAKRLGLLDLKVSGQLVDVSFPQLMERSEAELAYGADRTAR
jgi:hypothetical protein